MTRKVLGKMMEAEGQVADPQHPAENRDNQTQIHDYQTQVRKIQQQNRIPR